jgi:hypothetical protein
VIVIVIFASDHLQCAISYFGVIFKQSDLYVIIFIS